MNFQEGKSSRFPGSYRMIMSVDFNDHKKGYDV